MPFTEQKSLFCVVVAVQLLFLSFSVSTAARLLAIFPVPFRNHQIVFRPLIQNLLQRGHNVTVVTTNPQCFEFNDRLSLSSSSSSLSSPLSSTKNNVKDQLEIIDLSFAHNLDILNSLKSHDNNDVLEGSDMLRTVLHVMRTVAEVELKSKEMESLLLIGGGADHDRDRRQFDAVIVDWCGPAIMNAFAYKYKTSLIGITPGGAYITSHEAIGNPNHPVAFPSILMPFSEDLTLFQRVASTIFALKYRYLYFTEELPQQDEIVKQFFGPQAPNLWKIESDVDLLLVNSYQALGNSRPIGPTTIYLGGIHALNELPPLTWHLQKFLDKSISSASASSEISSSIPPPLSLSSSLSSMSMSSGVAYINLGEALTRVFIESQRLQILMKSIEKSSFDIVLNMNGIIDEINFNTTANIYHSSAMEQESVLAHPNVKLFITPGGQRDIEDAIHHKVPILGITFSSNLEHYLLQVIKHDAGNTINVDLDTSTEILAKIEAFAITERYQKNIEKLNQLVADQPQTTMERATWWIEYVIRHRGTQHLRNQWNQLSWLQYLLLDVIFTITLTTVVFVFAIVFACIRMRQYSKSLPFEKVTRRTRAKML